MTRRLPADSRFIAGVASARASGANAGRRRGSLSLSRWALCSFMHPFVWMLSTSVKPQPTRSACFPPVWIPRVFAVELYTGDLAQVCLPALLPEHAHRLRPQPGRHALLLLHGRLRLRPPALPGRNVLFLILLSTMMLPGQVTLIPTYLPVHQAGLGEHAQAADRAGILLASAFNIFLLRQFFMTMPLEMDDAAEIDGCSFLGIYWRIILPLSKPALGVVAIFQFTYDWNDFFGPLIYLNSPQQLHRRLGLRMLQIDIVLYAPMQAVMAMTLVSILPVLLVFFVAQRYFIQGIVITGVKG